MWTMAAATPNPVLVIPEHRLICRVCEKQYSKYTCPRCNLRYCSLACYKSHSLRCTESFMRDNVMEEMRDLHTTKESQKSMVEALKRIHFDDAGRSIFEDESLAVENVEGDDFDDEHGTIISDKTLELIAEGGDVSLDRLPVDERTSFLRAVAAGEISHLIQPWNPWWLNPRTGSIAITRQGTGLVKSVDPLGKDKSPLSNEGSAAADDEVPAPPSDALPEVRQLLHGDPSPLMSVQLVEVVYSYCFTLRFCNGDWLSEPLDTALISLSISQVLDQAASPESIGSAFAETMKTVCSPTFKHAGGFRFAVALCDDAAAVLRLGRACVVCTLAHLHRMLESAKRGLKNELKLEKQTRTEYELMGKPGSLNGNSNPSTWKAKPSTDSGANQIVSGGVARETRSQGNPYAELRMARDRRRWLNGTKTSSSREEEKMRIGSRAGLNSGYAGVPEKRHNKRTSNVELRKLSTAIRKVYFLMCWANEQLNEVFLSLALLIDAEKGRFLETRMTDNLGLQIGNYSRVTVTKSGPIIEEVVGMNAQASRDQ